MAIMVDFLIPLTCSTMRLFCAPFHPFLRVPNCLLCLYQWLRKLVSEAPQLDQMPSRNILVFGRPECLLIPMYLALPLNDGCRGRLCSASRAASLCDVPVMF